VTNVDFMRGIITPAIQYPNQPLKTETSKTPIPIPQELALELNRVPTKWGSPTLVVGAFGRPVAPYTIETAFKTTRETIEGLPEGGYPKGSASTTCATTSQVCSSRSGST
jgi:hypothetical protein